MHLLLNTEIQFENMRNTKKGTARYDLGSYPNTVAEFQYQYRKCTDLQFAFCTRQGPSIKCGDFYQISFSANRKKSLSWFFKKINLTHLLHFLWECPSSVKLKRQIWFSEMRSSSWAPTKCGSDNSGDPKSDQLYYRVIQQDCEL